MMKCGVRKCLRMIEVHDHDNLMREETKRLENCGRTFLAIVAMNLRKDKRFFSWIFHAHKLETELL